MKRPVEEAFAGGDWNPYLIYLLVGNYNPTSSLLAARIPPSGETNPTRREITRLRRGRGGAAVGRTRQEGDLTVNLT